MSRLQELVERAANLGIYVRSYAPGDGKIRYKVVTADVDYFAASNTEIVFSCTGSRKLVETFLDGWIHGYFTGKGA